VSETQPNARGYNWATLFLGEINIGTWPSRFGSLINRDNKIRTLPWESDLRNDALAMPGKNWKVQTRLFVREGAPHQQNPKLSKKIIKE
jgi:hypothetical protein